MKRWRSGRNRSWIESQFKPVPEDFRARVEHTVLAHSCCELQICECAFGKKDPRPPFVIKELDSVRKADKILIGRFGGACP